MCGIFGILRTDGRPVDLDVVGRAVRAMRHRGPDDEGYLLADTRTGRTVGCRGPDTQDLPDLAPLESMDGQPFDAALGFRRLSILDLTAGGHQPMSTADGRCHIVFNGEIYNYIELRTELEALGHRFRTRSDTEVLLAAYVAWGREALHRLVGMFALAVLDLRERRLFLARDFFSIKPLYYAAGPWGFAWASEIRPLLALPEVTRAANPGRVYDFLRFGFLDHGGETFFQSVHQLPGAHCLDVSLDRPAEARPVPYWQPDLEARADLSFDEAARRLRGLFLDSIRLHLRSDVPVGAALSGGIDSSSITAAMRAVQGDGLDLHTFTHVADEFMLSEESWAELAGRSSRATLHKVRPEPQDLVADLDPLIRTQEEPFGSTSIYAQHCVFRLARKAGIKVMLDGQGGDELLGGYRYHLGARLASLVRQGKLIRAARFCRRACGLPGAGLRVPVYAAMFLWPRALQPLASGLGPPRWLNARWLAEHGVSRGITPDRLYRKDGLRGQLCQGLMTAGLSELLRYEDRNSMAFSIESRVPFLTPALVNFALALPEEYLIGADGTTKSVFRQAMRGLVPDAILNRRDKVGFVTAEHRWLFALRPWVDNVLAEGVARVLVLDPKGMAAEWGAICAGRKAFDFRVWRWISLLLWAREFEVTF
jgi:asparagine synthase (glutamine-hydrolysing)